jgi:isopentenyl-diphosphate Delta-isomerase
MGSQVVGFAMPVLEAALKGEEELDRRMAAFEYELKTALFCTGSDSIKSLQEKKVWKWRE